MARGGQVWGRRCARLSLLGERYDEIPIQRDDRLWVELELGSHFGGRVVVRPNVLTEDGRLATHATQHALLPRPHRVVSTAELRWELPRVRMAAGSMVGSVHLDRCMSEEFHDGLLVAGTHTARILIGLLLPLRLGDEHAVVHPLRDGLRTGARGALVWSWVAALP